MGRRRKILTQKDIKQIERKYGNQANYIIGAIYCLFIGGVSSFLAIIFTHADLMPTGRIIVGILGGLFLLIAIVSYIRGTKLHEKELLENARQKREYEQKIAREQAEKARIKTEEQRQREEVLLKADMQSVDKMSGKDFEEYICFLYGKLGYEVTHTKLSGDFGADIIAKRNLMPHIIQTKRSASKVSISAVQEVVGAKSYYGAIGCIVVTNNYFTAPAAKLAMANHVELVDRDKLAKLIVSTQSLSAPIENTAKDPKNEGASYTMPAFYNEYNVNNTTYTTFLYSHYNHIYPLIVSGNVDEAYEKAIQVLSLEYENKTAVDVHYYLIRLADAFYKQRDKYTQCVDYTIKLCKRDIDLLPALFELKGCSNPLITRLCVIYEKQGKIEEAIELCDLAEKYGFTDNKFTPFSCRKIKLQKKLSATESNT